MRGLVRFLRLRRPREGGQDGHQWNGGSRAFESTHGLEISTVTRAAIMEQPHLEIYVEQCDRYERKA